MRIFPLNLEHGPDGLTYKFISQDALIFFILIDCMSMKYFIKQSLGTLFFSKQDVQATISI